MKRIPDPILSPPDINRRRDAIVHGIVVTILLGALLAFLLRLLWPRMDGGGWLVNLAGAEIWAISIAVGILSGVRQYKLAQGNNDRIKKIQRRLLVLLGVIILAGVVLAGKLIIDSYLFQPDTTFELGEEYWLSGSADDGWIITTESYGTDAVVGPSIEHIARFQDIVYGWVIGEDHSMKYFILDLNGPSPQYFEESSDWWDTIFTQTEGKAPAPVDIESFIGGLNGIDIGGSGQAD